MTCGCCTVHSAEGYTEEDLVQTGTVKQIFLKGLTLDRDFVELIMSVIIFFQHFDKIPNCIEKC